MAFEKIEQNMVLSSWNDAGENRIFANRLATHIEIPKFGVFKNKQSQASKDGKKALERFLLSVAVTVGTMLTGYGVSGDFWTGCLAAWVFVVVVRTLPMSTPGMH